MKPRRQMKIAKVRGNQREDQLQRRERKEVRRRRRRKKWGGMEEKMKNGQECVRHKEQKEQVFEESLFSFFFQRLFWSFLSVLRYEMRLASDIKWEEEIRGKREREIAR